MRLRKWMFQKTRLIWEEIMLCYASSDSNTVCQRQRVRSKRFWSDILTELPSIRWEETPNLLAYRKRPLALSLSNSAIDTYAYVVRMAKLPEAGGIACAV